MSLKPVFKQLFLLLFSCCCYHDHEAQTNRPNILFIIADDAGLEWSAYGCNWVQTPGFDDVAKNGILFKNAYTPNAKCAPSRSTILTGRNPWQLDAAMNHWIFFPNYFKVFPEVLAENGYHVGFTGKGYSPGKALKEDGSPRQLLIKSYDQYKLIPPTDQISNNDYTRNFEDFLSCNLEDEPWFFWIGFNEPHRAYEYKSGISKGGKKLEMVDRIPKYYPDEPDTRIDLLDYAMEIEYMDSHIVKTLKLLESKNLLENTLIVITSDHGMPFPRVKGNQYESANHIPLAIMWQSNIKHTNRKVDDYVATIDFAPTILEMAGISHQASGMRPIQGKSLMNILRSPKKGQIEKDRNFQLVGQERHDFGRPGDVGYPVRGLHKNGWLILKNYEPSRWPACNPETGYLNCDGGAIKTMLLQDRRNGKNIDFWNLNFGKRPAIELYDLKTDLDCVINLAGNPSYGKIVKKMVTEMENELRLQGDLRMLGYGHLYEKYRGAEIQNFYERYMSGEKFKLGWVNETDFETEIIDE